MKSKTSFSKLTPFKKDITRFAPAWGLYALGLLMVLINSVMSYETGRRLSMLPDLIVGFGVVNLIYAAVIAQLVYGDLYNTRMCYSLHALPQRRESWLMNHFGAALCFSLVPNILVSLCIMAALPENQSLMLLVLLAMELEFLFFFGVASVSTMVTGNRFAMLLVYAGLNFFSMLGYWLLLTIYLPLLDGVVLNMEPFIQLCPVVRIFDFEFMELKRIEIIDHFGNYNGVNYEFAKLTDGWGYLAILGGIGLVLMGLSVLLYRWRHLESAGDFVAFPKLKVPMLVVMTICVGGVAAFMGSIVLGDSLWIWLIVGIIVGYFGSLMLLERRIKIFRRKTLIGFAVLAAVLVCSYVLVAVDAFGVVRWVPEAKEVESVTVANYNMSDGYNEWYYGNRMKVTLEDEDAIEEILTAHQDILDKLEADEPINTGHRVFLRYTLKNGRTVMRSYYVEAAGLNYEIISRYFYTPEQILGYQDWETFLSELETLQCGGNEIPKEYYAEVMDALRKDCELGYVRLSSDSKEMLGYVYLHSGSTSRDLIVLSGAENAKAVLSKPEIVLGYTVWEKLAGSISFMNVNGVEVDSQRYQGLLDAMKADCEAGDLSLLTYENSSFYLEYNADGRYHSLSIPLNAGKTIAYIQENLLK